MEVGTLTDSLLSDIVRFIVVNIHPSNEIIFETNVLKRYVLIGNIINQITQNQPVGKNMHSSQLAMNRSSLNRDRVMMALFMDWFHYDPGVVHSVMLVEPAMLLLYKSCEQMTQVTDKLTMFLSKVVKVYDEDQSILIPDQESKYSTMINIQKVLLDCQSKGVVRDLKKLVNHHKLIAETQRTLKILVKAKEEVNIMRQNSKTDEIIPSFETPPTTDLSAFELEEKPRVGTPRTYDEMLQGQEIDPDMTETDSKR